MHNAKYTICTNRRNCRVDTNFALFYAIFSVILNKKCLFSRAGKDGVNMYRQYENPRELEKLYNKKKQDYQELKVKYFQGIITEDYLHHKYEELEELKDRVRFAWDDEENG